MYITSICFYADSMGCWTASGRKYSIFGDPQGLFVLAGAAVPFGYGTLPATGN